MRLALVGLLLLLTAKSWGFDLSAGYSNSASSQSQYLSVGYNLSEDFKLSGSYSSYSEDMSAGRDNKAESYKLAARYRWSPSFQTSVWGRSKNELYNFEGATLGAQAKFTLVDDLSVWLGYEGGRYKYKPITDEVFDQRIVMIGSEIKAVEGITLGLDLSLYNYAQQGPLIQRVFDEKTIAQVDIQEYVTALPRNDLTFSVDYEMTEWLSLSAALTRTNPWFESYGSTNSGELSADITIGSLVFSPSVTNTRGSVGSGQTTRYSLGIGYLY